ncbi:uncharacterized protein LOC105181254 [Harpegnathos saltator]|uniref:uncharacterized protein LOC105181254 n=1 Tax=Harpegnathos saltator TaxID=610380 RepID=UPI00059098B0|nr:uncharacterized protein LOC105181254 [Harpegnathos saltator]
MKFSLILGIALLLTIVHIARARKLGCSSCGGSLGSGTNSCKCGDVVVKAARVPKPLYQATPEAINEAATARKVAQLISAKTYPGSAVSFSPSSQTRRSYDIRSGISHSSSSSSSSSSSAGSSSSVNLLRGPIDGGLGSVYPYSQRSTYNPGCGCGSQSKMSLELNDLLSSDTEGQVVPRFPPIGDLCAPSKQSSYEVTKVTKVTPAYPKLPDIQPPVPVCVNVVNGNGQIDRTELEKLNSATYSGLRTYNSPVRGSGSIGGFTSGGVGATATFGISGQSSLYDNWYKGTGSGTRVSGQLGLASATAGSYVDSSAVKMSSGTNSFSEYDTSYGSVNAQGSIGSNRCTDFGEDLELPEDYSYPGQPADAVSLTLAYKNLFPHTTVYRQKWFVPEDKLAFGHRTVPVDSMPGKRPLDIPEEKLQILDKPIVELKPVTPVAVSIGVYNEQEEAKLAELEAIERERISQEEIANLSPQGGFITYGDLGYAPVDGLIVPGALARHRVLQISSGIGLADAEDVSGGCGPVGPPVPGYVPGSIVVNREVVEIEEENEDENRRNDAYHYRRYLEDMSDEEDDLDDTTSGIFARLRNTALNYGPVSCPR